MNRFTRAALRRPKTAVGLWVAAIFVLAGLGANVQDRLSETSFDLSGTESSRALADDRAAFGRSELVTVLLEGPPAELRRQGPALARALRERNGVVTPWDTGPGLERLRPAEDQAVLLVKVPHGEDTPSEDVIAPVQRTVAQNVDAPVRPRMTGLPVLSDALNEATIDATDKAAKLAFPMLLIVLLFVFRSVIAAAIPAVVGLATVAAGTGVVAALTELFDLTALSVSLVSMMGLALGVDYTLLIVSRFREELAEGADAQAAAATAAGTAGRTVSFAGAALTVAMLVGLVLSPGDILVSAATGVVTAVVLSWVTGAVVVPAVLSLLGERVNRWRIGRVRIDSPLLTGLARGVMRRPVPVVTGLLVLLFALAIPAFGIKTDPSNVRLLPDDDRARQDYQAIEDALGPGYASPFEVVFTGRRGAIDAPIEALERFREQVARDPSVEGVLGPAASERLTGVPGLTRGRGDDAAPVAGPPGPRGPSEPRFVLAAAPHNAARVFVFPTTFPSTPAAADLRDRLSSAAAETAQRSGTEAAVGGLSGRFIDYDEETAARLPVIVLALSLVTYLLLIPLLRAVVLPLAAILLNLVTVGAAFGALALLFDGDSPPLGGPGSLDVISLIGIFTVIFALSIDYEVFLLSRMREGYLRHRDAQAAVLHGVGRTASVVTGAAAIMCAVFLAFAVSDFITIRQFGVGLTAAVVLDAIVLRLLLLPAVMRLLGDRSWWLPTRRSPARRPAGAGATPADPR